MAGSVPGSGRAGAVADIRSAGRCGAVADLDRAAKLSGGYVDPANGRVPFGDWAVLWLDSPGKRPSALARDESIVGVHLMPAFGNRPLSSITPADVQALVTEWTAKSAPRTVRRQYGVLRAILNAAVAHELIARSPCRGIRLPAVTQTGRHVVTADELAMLADAMGDYGPMAYLGAVLGLRWGECAGLRVGRLDFLRSTLEVAEAPHARAGRANGDGSAEVTGGTAHDGRSRAAHGAPR